MLVHTISGLDKKKIVPVAVISPRNERLAHSLGRIGVRVITINDINRPLKNKILKAIIQIPNFYFSQYENDRHYRARKARRNTCRTFLFRALEIVPAKAMGKKFVWVGQTLSDFFSYPLLSKFLMRFSDTTILTCADFSRFLEIMAWRISGRPR